MSSRILMLVMSCVALPGFRTVGQCEEATPLPPIREVAPGIYELGKMRLDKNANSLSFPARVQMVSGYLEYLLVAPYGSTHESLLVTEIQPSDLHFAMLLLGAKGAGILTPAPDDKPPAQIDGQYLKRAPRLQGDRVTITATYQHDGTEQTNRVEEWIVNKLTNKPAKTGPWMYTGSMFSSGKFLAQIEGCFAAMVTNPAALINNPRPGHDDDQAWVVNEKAVPPRQTSLQIEIRLETGGTERSSAKQ